MCSFFQYYGLKIEVSLPDRVAAAPHTSPAISPNLIFHINCHPETELKMEFDAILRPEYKFDGA